jgi:hypothetical protein
MTARQACMLIACLGLISSAAAAQRLPSDDRKLALTRKENWGVSIGVEMISASFHPTRCPSLATTADGSFIKSTVPCDGVRHAYESRGVGVSMNAGVMFLRHFLLGGEVGTVGFGGNRTIEEESPPVSYRTSTTNSLVGSWYVGLITSPMGKSPKLGRKFWLGGLTGWSKWSGERTLESCTGCAAEPLPMGSAYFLQPFAMFGGGDKDGGGGLRLSYKHYVHGTRAMQSALTLGLFFAFGRL